jgi:hypothetical protein
LVKDFRWEIQFDRLKLNEKKTNDGRVLQCLPEPLEPQYGGGILRNADFSAGLRGWSTFGYGRIAESTSAAGNGFAVALNRTRAYQSVSQKVYLQGDTHYTLSGTILQWMDRSASPRVLCDFLLKLISSVAWLQRGCR